MILYDFDICGIIYTVVLGFLTLLFFVPLILLLSKKKPRTKSTVFFRVVDILLLVVLIVAWAAFILIRVPVFGISVANADGSLALLFNSETVFSISKTGALVAVWETILGIAWMGLVTLFALLDFILTFTHRKKVKVPTSAGIVQEVEIHNENSVPVGNQRAAEVTPTDDNSAEGYYYIASETDYNVASTTEVQTEQSVEPKIIEEEPPVLEVVEVLDEEDEHDIIDDDIVYQEEVAESAPKTEIASPIPENIASKALWAEPRKIIINRSSDVKSTTENKPITKEPQKATESTPAPAKKKTTAKPKTVSSSEKSRATAKKTTPSASKQTDKSVSTGPAEALPITRRVVITNRINVVNMFNDYLNDKNKSEREKLSNAISQIRLK